MENIDENPKKYLQLGAIPHDLCMQFRKQAAQRKFKQVDILTLLIEYWISLDKASQINFYHSGSHAKNIVDAASEAHRQDRRKKKYRRSSSAG